MKVCAVAISLGALWLTERHDPMHGEPNNSVSKSLASLTTYQGYIQGPNLLPVQENYRQAVIPACAV